MCERGPEEPLEEGGDSAVVIVPVVISVAVDANTVIFYSAGAVIIEVIVVSVAMIVTTALDLLLLAEDRTSRDYSV